MNGVPVCERAEVIRFVWNSATPVSHFFALLWLFYFPIEEHGEKFEISHFAVMRASIGNGLE